MNTLTKRLGWTLSFLALAIAIGFALRTSRTGGNALSWNVRQIIAAQLRKDVASLTTNDLARIETIELHDRRTPLLTLPGWLSALERFVPDQKIKITDDDLRQLDQLPALRGLYVTSAGVTDAGLVHLKKLSSLEELYLSHTQVTDAGLVDLAKLSSLQELYLSDTQVTRAGVRRLRQQLPNCKIYN